MFRATKLPSVRRICRLNSALLPHIINNHGNNYRNNWNNHRSALPPLRVTKNGIGFLEFLVICAGIGAMTEMYKVSCVLQQKQQQKQREDMKKGMVLAIEKRNLEELKRFVAESIPNTDAVLGQNLLDVLIFLDWKEALECFLDKKWQLHQNMVLDTSIKKRDIELFEIVCRKCPERLMMPWVSLDNGSRMSVLELILAHDWKEAIPIIAKYMPK